MKKLLYFFIATALVACGLQSQFDAVADHLKTAQKAIELGDVATFCSETKEANKAFYKIDPVNLTINNSEQMQEYRRMYEIIKNHIRATSAQFNQMCVGR